ncbi:PAS domain-containing protein [Oceanibaculum pacificum]|uniref:PAS domain-containing protein n=1 Tax=Oceanibaculum pacificum TaxID=580166 RepID=UPI0018DB1D3A|nr:PAS domain-containing protein [Oceanibaculum pacificum]
MDDAAPILPSSADRRLQLVLRHWLDIRKGQRLPSRADLDPLAIWDALPYVWMCDYLRDSHRFRFRLAGEELNFFHHGNLVGRYLDDLIPIKFRKEINNNYLKIVKTPCFLYAEGAIHSLTRQAVRGERLVLPLRETGTEASLILGITIVSYAPDFSDETGAATPNTRYIPVPNPCLCDAPAD